MSLDDIWDEPIELLTKSAPANDDSSPLKRPRESLFLPDSGSDNDRPSKRVTPAPPAARPDIDSLFEDLDKDEEDNDLRYKPLAPALDLARLAKEAEAKHARAKQTASSQAFAGGSKTWGADGAGTDKSAKAKPGDGDKGGRRVVLKLNDERLVAPEGFPSLIEDIKGFQSKGKGNEHADLNRLLQVYQFWTHRMYPKTSFKDTINRVEKLCHSKRMQVRLSVWRDEFKGVTKDTEQPDNSDVIDLTEPTLVGTEENGKDGLENQTDQASSRAPSLPPTSSEAGDDDFDIDAVIRAEEERLAVLRAATADSESLHTPNSLTLPEKAPPIIDPDTSAMDVDEASLWEAFDDPVIPEPSHDTRPSAAPAGDDDDMWDIVDEVQQGAQRKLTKGHIPLSGVNVQASLENTSSGNTSTTVRATNDDDWDEMYS